MRFKVSAIAVVYLFVYTGASLAGTITGKVNFEGKSPRVRKLNMKVDQACAEYYKNKSSPVSNDAVLNGNGTLRWSFVYIVSGIGKKFKAPSEEVVITQEGCRFTPRVVGLMVKQKLHVKNSDQTKHNFHIMGKNNYNRTVGKGKEFSRRMKRAHRLKPTRKGRYKVMARIKCDLHRWMTAWVAVLPHPYFSVTDEKGTYEISGLPPGTYELAAWHEKYGVISRKVSVGAENEQKVDFTFSAN